MDATRFHATPLRVIMVDNDWSTIDQVREALAADETFEFLGYVSSRAALDAFLQELFKHQRQPDLALVDLGLPRPAGGLGAGLEGRPAYDDREEGLMVIDRIREISPDTVVVALSGYYHAFPYLIAAVEERDALPVAKQEAPVGPEWGQWLRRQLHVAKLGYFHPSSSLTRLQDRAETAEGIHELPLTLRQLEVGRLYADGCSDRQIAELLNITEDGVRGHFKEMRRRLGVQSRWQIKLILEQHWAQVRQVTRHLDGQQPKRG